jgi:hypothetical protein
MPIHAPVGITGSLPHDTIEYVLVEPFIGAVTVTIPWQCLGMVLFIETLTAKLLKM